jgi:hypothetical protein
MPDTRFTHRVFHVYSLDQQKAVLSLPKISDVPEGEFTNPLREILAAAELFLDDRIPSVQGSEYEGVPELRTLLAPASLATLTSAALGYAKNSIFNGVRWCQMAVKGSSNYDYTHEVQLAHQKTAAATELAAYFAGLSNFEVR